MRDIIEGTRKDKNSVYEFNNVRGRDNDFIMLDQNTPIHSESITHAIKFSDIVTAYQIRYTKSEKYTIYLKSNSNISGDEIKRIRSRSEEHTSELQSRFDIICR